MPLLAPVTIATLFFKSAIDFLYFNYIKTPRLFLFYHKYKKKEGPHSKSHGSPSCQRHPKTPNDTYILPRQELVSSPSIRSGLIRRFPLRDTLCSSTFAG